MEGALASTAIYGAAGPGLVAWAAGYTFYLLEKSVFWALALLATVLSWPAS